MIGYRYCVRNYLECLDQWKRIDQERSQKYYEFAYMDAFAILASTQMHLGNLNKRISGIYRHSTPYSSQKLILMILTWISLSKNGIV